jgi:hypothetical protein
MTLVVLLRVGGGILGRLIGGPHTAAFVLGETAVFVIAGVMLLLFLSLVLWGCVGGLDRYGLDLWPRVSLGKQRAGWILFAVHN